MSSVPPDYFRTEAERYKANPTDREKWLTEQIAIAGNSLIAYQTELISLYQEAEKLGAVFDKNGNVAGLQPVKGDAALVTTVGAVLAAIPTGYTQAIGGVMILASSFFQKAENKRNAKRVTDIISIATTRYQEAQKVGEYKTSYERELFILKMVPVVLTAILIWFLIY